MKQLYLTKESPVQRKIIVDMAYLVTHKKIRLPKYLFEDNLYLPYKNSEISEKFYLSKDKIQKEDEYHYYFDFPFKPEQVENV